MKNRSHDTGDTPQWLDRRSKLKNRMINLFALALGWVGITVLFYIVFSLLFETPIDKKTRESYDVLNNEYIAINQRLDSINQVVENLKQRDSELFEVLFRTTPNDNTHHDKTKKLEEHDNLLSKSNQELGRILLSKMNNMNNSLIAIDSISIALLDTIRTTGTALNSIPSIQPIINNDLILFTASFGMRIHPFYKKPTQHNGIDYTVPEDTRVFATADGVIKTTAINNTSASGKSIIIDHKNGYETTYSHLNTILLGQGRSVQRGDVIARTGNSGLSLLPHLHYEISYNGTPIDPINYFFNELTADEYEQMKQIAQTGMQSFD